MWERVVEAWGRAAGFYKYEGVLRGIVDRLEKGSWLVERRRERKGRGIMGSRQREGGEGDDGRRVGAEKGVIGEGTE